MGRRRALVGQPLLYATTICVSLGVFVFGYDQGVMSGLITGPYFRAYFRNPTRFELGSMVAILEIGALITSLMAGTLGDLIGRRRTLLLGAVIFVCGGAIQSLSTGFPMMVFGRIIAGFGVGFLSMIVPVYQSEISPADHRGKLAAMEFTLNVTGYAFSVWLDWSCSFIESDLSWRLPLAGQCVFGTLLALGGLIIPESPRWLLDTDQDAFGLRVIADLHGGDPHEKKAIEEYKSIKENVYQGRATDVKTYAQMWSKYRYRVLIAMSSQLFAQLNGINVISYYAPLVFEQAGWIGRDAILMTGFNALIYVASTVPPWYLVDRLGRRPILLSGAVVMCIALSLTGWFIFLDAAFTPNSVVVCVIIFNAAFGASWGPIPWLYPPEILPLPVRVKGVSLSTATNWFANFIVGEGTPVLQDWIAWRLYPMHAFFCACSFVLVFFMYPETAGVPLEDMGRLFNDEDEDETSSLVNASVVLRRDEIEVPVLKDGDEESGPSFLDALLRRRRDPDRSQYAPIDG